MQLRKIIKRKIELIAPNFNGANSILTHFCNYNLIMQKKIAYFHFKSTFTIPFINTVVITETETFSHGTLM